MVPKSQNSLVKSGGQKVIWSSTFENVWSYLRQIGTTYSLLWTLGFLNFNGCLKRKRMGLKTLLGIMKKKTWVSLVSKICKEKS